MDWKMLIGQGLLGAGSVLVWGVIATAFRWLWIGFKYDLTNWKAKSAERAQRRTIRPIALPSVNRIEPPVILRPH
jgi:hypothetical protein